MQIPLSDWPAGLCREIAAIEPSAVTEHLASRLVFDRDRDDLAAFSAAIFTIDGVPFALQLYDQIPTGHFTLIVTTNLSGDQTSVENFLNWSGQA
jgi:hypothetical protein